MVPCPEALLRFVFSLTLLSAAAFASSPFPISNGTTVFDLLPQFGLPSGLLPSSVRNFSFANDGRFVVEMEKPCSIQFDYLVYYERKITGTLKYGSITNLKGIRVKRLFLWLDVEEIRVDLPPSYYIYFQVGLINKKLDAGQFRTVHPCQNGVSCEGSWKDLLKVPTPFNEVTMLLTE
nr:TPA_asm: hypothetical protein HUJ06_031563 [Nelumbo nucifera]